MIALQSTLPHGKRPRKSHWTLYKEMLQSTLPHGERPGMARPPLLCRCFNPRSRTESDAREHDSLLLRDGPSIHAPARGATRRFESFRSDQMLQSTLPHGERHGQPLRRSQSDRFNPRSRTGSDYAASCPAAGLTSFNPRSRTGSDACTRCTSPLSEMLQSTLPHGERPTHRHF